MTAPKTAKMTPEIKALLRQLNKNDKLQLSKFDNTSDASTVEGELLVDAVRQITIAMEEQKMKQSELAKRSGVTRQRISALLHSNGNLKMETLAKLAHALNRSVRIQLLTDSQRVIVSEVTEMPYTNRSKSYTFDHKATAPKSKISTSMNDRYKPSGYQKSRELKRNVTK